MEKSPVRPAWQRAVIRMSAVVCTAVIVALLYWAREVFIPLALAVFFAYVLSPVVAWLQRRGLGRMPSVILVVAVAGLVCGGTFYFVVQQLAGMTNDLVERKDVIKGHLTNIRTATVGEGESQFGKMLEELEQAISPTPARTPTNPPVAGVGPMVPVAERPQAVRVESSKPTWAQRLQGLVTPAGEAASLAAFAFILVVFILLAKEDIQDRILRVVSGGRVTSATRATRDAGQRIGRYLLSQLVVNTSFGLILTVVMLVVGLKYALLWGFIALVMRYVPYIGTWVGVILPVGFSLAMSDSLWQPAVVLAAYAVLELLCNNLIEPRLYGSSMGISELALLLSAAFWAFLWGPIGLILSGPLTTCLLMLGKYHKEFRGLYVLLGNDPPLARGTILFQRLVAGNVDEAVRAVEPAIVTDSPTAVYDDAVVPALVLLKRAREEGEYEDDEERVLAAAGEVLNDLADRVQAEGGVTAAGDRTRVIVCPVRDDVDHLACTGFAATLPAARWAVEITSPATLTSELIGLVGRFAPQVVCLAGVVPVSETHVRYLCKRLRAVATDLTIVAAVWGGEKSAEVAEAVMKAGATAVEFSVADTRGRLLAWRPVFRDEAETNRPRAGVGTAGANNRATPAVTGGGSS